MVKRAHLIGIDLNSSPSKPTACAVLDDELHLSCFDFFRGDAHIIEAMEHHHPHLVAIDSFP